jgi:hypothetical protein
MGAAHIRQDDPILMVNGMPSPALLFFSFYKTPHFIEF